MRTALWLENLNRPLARSGCRLTDGQWIMQIKKVGWNEVDRACGG